MREAELKIYKDLQEHLDQYPIGFPATKSGVELRLLKYLFTPEEAKLATRLNDKYESLEVIYERMKKTGMSIRELKVMLDNMVKKGAIHYKVVSGQKNYANAYFIIGMYEYQVNNLTKEFLDLFWAYNWEAFGFEYLGTKISQFRTVPVEKSVSHEYFIPTYEDLRKIIENTKGQISVSECICRKGKELVGEPCKITTRLETCVGFEDTAQLYINEGWARAISKEEALQILRKNEEEGLVLQAGNTINPEFICSCCGCCCGTLSNVKRFTSHPTQYFSYNYQAEVDRESCLGCETCKDRCQMKAIRIVKDLCKINKKRCIGCGNCVLTCPQEAIHLKEKEELTRPFETLNDLYSTILDEKLKNKTLMPPDNLPEFKKN